MGLIGLVFCTVVKIMLLVVGTDHPMHLVILFYETLINFPFPSQASQSDSAGNTNSTHNSSSEGSSHGCDHSDFCRQGGFLDDDSIVAPMHAQDLVAAGCLSKLPNSPTPTPISPISIDRMPGESSK